MKIHLFRKMCFAAAMMLLVSSTTYADLITVTSATDSVQIFDSATMLDQSNMNSSLSGGGVGETSGDYSSSITSSYTGNSLSSENTQTFPETAGAAPGSFTRATSVVLFTANQQIMASPPALTQTFTTFGNDPSLGNNVREWILFDITANQQLYRTKSGFLDGGDGGEPDQGNPFGLLLNSGSEYSWTYTQELSNFNWQLSPEQPVYTGGGSSLTNFTAVGVPEPTACGLLGLASIGLAFRRRRAL